MTRAHTVFTGAFVEAMHPTLVLPMAILLAGALATSFVRVRGRKAQAVEVPEAAVA